MSKYELRPEVMTENIRNYRIKKITLGLKEISKEIEKMVDACQDKDELEALSEEFKKHGLEEALNELIFTFASSF